MFDRRGAWERKLEAVGITATGRRWQLPLSEIFRYQRGFTPLRAYDQIKGLGNAGQDELHRDFARYLGERMAERGIELEAVELAWVRTNLDTGRTQRKVFGTWPTRKEAP